MNDSSRVQVLKLPSMGKPAIPTRLDRPVILHLSADYPDSFRNRTTLAVRNLVVASPDFEHVVVSLKRQAIPWSTYLRKDPRVVAMLSRLAAR